MVVFLIIRLPHVDALSMQEELLKFPPLLKRSELKIENSEEGCQCQKVGGLVKDAITTNWDRDFTLLSDEMPELMCCCALTQVIKRPQVQPILFNGPVPVDTVTSKHVLQLFNWHMWGSRGASNRAGVDKENVPDSCYNRNRKCCAHGLSSLLSLFCLIMNPSQEDSMEKLASVRCLPPRRPPWNNYFMNMAYLVASRSNCIKRGVGAVIVADRRIVSTGYNGTPFGAPNCIDGGCKRCSDPNIKSGHSLDTCTCLHAEANALLEAGRARCLGATLYVTLHPCLQCIKLIGQSGIKSVFFGERYESTTEAKGTELLDIIGVTLEHMPPIHQGVDI